MDRESKIIWNPYTKGYFDNPYPHLKRCREENPIHKGAHNELIFFRYKDINEIIRSNDFEVSELSTYLQTKEPYIFKNSDMCPYLSKGTQKWTMYLNGDEHKSLRAVMGKSFKEFDLNIIIKESINTLNNRYKNSISFDLVEYCAYFIFLVTEKLFGIKDFESFEKVKKYSNMLARSQDIFIPKQIYKEINSWFLWGKDIFHDSEYKENIRFFANQLNLNYTEEDIYSIMSISVMAAFETSKDNLTMALYQILRDPKLTDYVLHNEIKKINLLIEELFRFSSPLQYTVRVNKQPIEYNDTIIPSKSKIYLCLASANRDPDFFINPDEIIPDRYSNEHLAFGGGNHFCLGAQISRQEMRYCLKPMVSFLSNFEIDNSKPTKWAKQIFMRTVDSLSIKLK
ncbi:cytochrome P450 [Aquimarina algiphila]|uniref:Cytochrome P450 n=1 Tax=Aquimarina algiphila TaxID=2047982 RepID=A0A554VKS6_9FLAO|nr:cytochrome P450 [Aquimarina algiphila]TSE08639.1 cytochrome P450 [Aquimarina algiphila]